MRYLLTILTLFTLLASSALAINGSCRSYLEKSPADFMTAFQKSNKTRYFYKTTEKFNNDQRLKAGRSYTALINHDTNELIVGYKTPALFATWLSRLFQTSHSGTHNALGMLYKNTIQDGETDLANINFHTAAFRINKDLTIDVAGFSAKERNLTGALAVTVFIKELYPSAIIRMNAGRLSDIDSGSEDTIYLDSHEQVIFRTDDSWIVR